MKIKKSQTAIEFMILFGFVLFFFVTFFLIIQENMADRIRENQKIIIKEIALNIQNEINLALESGEGYQRNFKVPEKAGKKEYEVNINQDMVYVKTIGDGDAIALPVAEVVGDVIKGTNIIKKENNQIKLNT